MARQGYAKLSNGLWLNEKVNDLIDANPHAFAMWTLAISYCSDELNDGVLTERALRRIGADRTDLIDLVRFGLLDELEDGRYAIHDYLKHQNSREEVEKDKTAAKERMRRNRAAKRSPEPEPAESENKTEPEEPRSEEVRANTGRTNGERSEEVRPKFLGLNQNQNQESSNEDSLPQTPSRREGAGESAPESEYTPEFEQFWATYPRHEGKRRAFAEFQRARRKTNHVILIAKASLYAADPNRDPAYTLSPANWLRDEHWLDDPLPAKPKPGQPEPAAEKARRLTDVDWLCTHVDDPEAQLAALDLPEKAQALARARYPDEWYRLWRRGTKRAEQAKTKKTLEPEEAS